MNTTIEQQAQNLAHSLGITVWITKDGLRIVQHKPADGGTEVSPQKQAKPTPHGAPADTKSIETT